MKSPFFFLLMLACVTACQRNREIPTADLNPAAEGFDWEHSDPAAIELADSVMKAQGGRNAWEETRFLSWSFFGSRNLVWDKQKDRIRIESLADSTIYLLDLKAGKGRVRVRGVELTESDTLGEMLKRAEQMWTNDVYWLIMPFKLKDTGVTLKYLGEDSLANGDLCNVIQITFQHVGNIPASKYHVYVDRRDNLVKQWSYFELASQATATAVWPFDNYQKYGRLLLSADRSDGNGPRNVKVDEALPNEFFTEF